MAGARVVITEGLGAPPGAAAARHLGALALALAAAQAALLAVLPGPGGAAIAAAGLAFAAVSAVTLRAFVRSYPHPRLGACNGVTLARAAVATALVAPLVLPGALAGREGLAWALVVLVAAGLALDGLDGWLARRSGLASPLGARFDMEVDALLAALLALVALASGKAGPWVLALGFMRYAFVVAARIWPWLNRPLPERRSRKTVCVIQIAALVALIAPAVTPPLSTAVGLAATAALIWSFAVDLRWLATARRRGAAA